MDDPSITTAALDHTAALDQADEDLLRYTDSDEMLEAAAAGTTVTKVTECTLWPCSWYCQ